MAEQQIVAKTESPSIDVLIKELESKNLDLNPLYQRDIVWDQDMQIKFIDSIIRGYVPNNIIINKSDGKWICIDGKQRLTSILKFKNNEIPHIIEADDPEDTEYVFYSDIPDKINADYPEEQIRIMTPDERQLKFNDRQVPMAYYSNISYETQADIFNRIQYGKVATNGEKVRTQFKTEAVVRIFNEFTNEVIDLFDLNKSKTNRDFHVPFVLDVMYMYHKKEACFMTSKDRPKFLKHLDKVQNMNTSIDEVKQPLNIAFSKKIINSNQILKLKLIKNFKLGMLYFINDTFDASLIQSSKINDEYIKNIRSVILNTWKKWNVDSNKLRTTKNNQAITKMKKYFDEEYSKIFDEIDSEKSNNTDNSDYQETSCDIKSAPIKKSTKKKTVARLKASK